VEHPLREDARPVLLSVDAVTGAVCYHGRHGRFIEMAETG